VYSGGSFGRRANGSADFTVAAVNVAKAIGRPVPVRVQFSREDDTGAGFYRPMMVHAVKVGLDAKGGISEWKHTIVGQSIIAGTPMESMMKEGIDPNSIEGVFQSPYALPMMAGELHSPSLPVKPLWWRSVGNTHTAYVMETLMDELAAAAGKDPLAFRLGLLKNSERAAGVLKLAAQKAGYGRAAKAGIAQGIAMHHSFETFVAQVQPRRVVVEHHSSVTRIRDVYLRHVTPQIGPRVQGSEERRGELHAIGRHRRGTGLG
jgi:isoquinoline 1-oxidoreductase beta subunit